ncbi:MAG: thiamine diphosphokinase, partial [Parafannyhessea umbonata]|nr:thiamine diphosphokinase [Parafannyhessea umbonata]
DSCDVFVHGYAELSVALLSDFAPVTPAAASSGVLRALVVAGSPEPSSADLVRRLAAKADYVVAADAGANVLMEAGITPDVFCGDADSAADDAARWARAVAQRDIRFPSEKYATDLSLAIDCARHEAARRSARLEITLTCATGGRPDHALAVVGQLAHAADASPKLVEDAFTCRVLSPEGCPLWQLPEDSEGRIFSAISVAEGTVASERGLKWELDHKRLPLLGDEGVSNVVASSAATVECHAGRLAAFLLR